jgi:hypothetical protein
MSDQPTEQTQPQAPQEQPKAAEEKPKPKPVDKYHAVKTGDTFNSIAKEYKREGKGVELMNFAHPGGVSNREIAASHLTLIQGTHVQQGSIMKELKPIVADDIDENTPLTEGQGLLLPEGWA